ncbi:hypothetical protein [Acaryochloris thomasi]|nr:hypothetical protein [Acaryochloris thomasi]
MSAMFFYLWQMLHQCWQALQVPMCFISAWGLILLMGWRLTLAVRTGVSVSTRLHQIPCADCQFFTGDYRLKCTVHPDTALSERAIDCRDFEVHPASNY